MTPPASLLYSVAANALVVIHLLFVLFVTGGGLLLLRNRKWAFIHLPAALWAATVEFSGWYCPLTPLENWLRQQGGGSGYGEGFVEHYLLPLLYPAALTREVQIFLGLAVIAINALVYFLAYRRWRADRAPHPSAQDQPASGPGSTGPDTP